MAASAGDTEFNTIGFEKRLTSLKDSQESINNCCHWCLENRHHHKKIVTSWLNVLKRVRVEQRLTLFYLANDVIQYSKRRNYDFVESWSTTLQKATTMVRDEKVKHKILRIFKIWEQRGIYGEEFITDLSGLISATPSARKSDEPQEFQSSYLITKIKSCAKLEVDTDLKLKKFKEHNPKMMDSEALCASLKDRAHVDDVEKEMDEYVTHMESYVNALKLEIKARNNLISLLQQAEVHLDTDKKDVKLVANAYRAFAMRVKNLKKKLEEMMPTLNSPIPSPDINAPSPSPDSDLDLPSTIASPPKSVSSDVMQLTYTNAGFYNPVPPPSATETNTFPNNGFTSFLGANMPFNIENINAALFNTIQSPPRSQNPSTNETVTTDIYNNSISSLFPTLSQPPPPPESISTPMPVAAPSSADYPFNSQVPLMPPPIPPFSKPDVSYNNSYSESYSTDTSTNFSNSTYNPPNNSYTHPPITTYPSSGSSYQTTPTTNFQSPGSFNSNFQPTTPTNTFEPPPLSSFGNTFSQPPPITNPPYVPSEEYNPEEEPETWENEGVWEPPLDLETPESPPNFEKESYSEPVEYHDNQTMGTGIDIDHRVLSLIGPSTNSESESNHRKKDVDHRNLISLTGSPKENNASKKWKVDGDQDYRTQKQVESGDRDYRMHFNFDNFQVPPPPPLPNQLLLNKQHKKHGQSPRKAQDNVESIDMDLSDDDNNHDGANLPKETINDNLKVVTLIDEEKMLEPPPPFPEFSDEADANANNLLDDLNNDLDETDDIIAALSQPPPNHRFDDEMMNSPALFEINNVEPMWNNRIAGINPMQGIGPPLFPMNGPPPNARGGPPPDILLPPLSEYLDFHRHGRGNKRGNFNNRGDFRGRPHLGRGNRRGRGNYRGNRGGIQIQRGGAQMQRGGIQIQRGISLLGNPRSRPSFFRGRFRGGF